MESSFALFVHGELLKRCRGLRFVVPDHIVKLYCPGELVMADELIQWLKKILWAFRTAYTTNFTAAALPASIDRLLILKKEAEGSDHTG